MNILRKCDFAARRGVSRTAITNWIRAGKLFGPALTADGHIIVEIAEQQLRDRPDGRTLRAARPQNPQRASAAETVTAASTQHSDLRLAAALEIVDELMSEFEQFAVYELPAKLGLGRDSVELARREWQEFRQQHE
jgi:hypothetical protein